MNKGCDVIVVIIGHVIKAYNSFLCKYMSKKRYYVTHSTKI